MLDKSKPYGEVFGTGINHKYTQNGKFYSSSGFEVNEKGNKKRPNSKVKSSDNR